MSIPVVAEVSHGFATARSDTTAQEVRTRLLGDPRVEVNEDIARVAGERLATADDSVEGAARVRANDVYIAAIADVLDDAVLMDTVEDFETLDVPVETD